MFLSLCTSVCSGVDTHPECLKHISHLGNMNNTIFIFCKVPYLGLFTEPNINAYIVIPMCGVGAIMTTKTIGPDPLLNFPSFALEENCSIIACCHIVSLDPNTPNCKLLKWKFLKKVLFRMLFLYSWPIWLLFFYSLLMVLTRLQAFCGSWLNEHLRNVPMWWMYTVWLFMYGQGMHASLCMGRGMTNCLEFLADGLLKSFYFGWKKEYDLSKSLIIKMTEAGHKTD